MTAKLPQSLDGGPAYKASIPNPQRPDPPPPPPPKKACPHCGRTL